MNYKNVDALRASRWSVVFLRHSCFVSWSAGTEITISATRNPSNKRALLRTPPSGKLDQSSVLPSSALILFSNFGCNSSHAVAEGGSSILLQLRLKYGGQRWNHGGRCELKRQSGSKKCEFGDSITVEKTHAGDVVREQITEN